ncbi:MAG: porin family protein [Muribaculaceae bacterium]|nr:porin family protein [Muribaculaceae bacterium]
MDDKWIESIRDKMAHYDVVPPPGLLDAVEARIRARKMRNRRVFGAVAASVALIGGVSVALIPDMPDTVSGPLMSDVAGEDKPTVFARQIAENKTVSEPLPRARKSAKSVLMSREANPTSEKVKPIEIEDNRQELLEVATETSSNDTERYVPNKKIEDGRYAEYSSIVDHAYSHSKRHSSLSVGASASANGLGGMLNDDNVEGHPLLASSSMPLTRMGGGVIGESNSNSSPTPTYVEWFDHRLPIRASIDVSWPVGHGLSVGTGLTYSYLKSDIRYGYSDLPLFKASQCLHFIGIPVNVRYTPWSFRKLGIYVSAGFMAEKCVAGQIKEADPQYPLYQYEGYDSRPFQFSFNGAGGVQYSLTHKCAVFIEPGVGIYLKNGSRLRTIYSERPVTFNVNVGLRFGH